MKMAGHKRNLLVIRIIALLGVCCCIYWWIIEPSLEPIAAFFAALVAFITTFIPHRSLQPPPPVVGRGGPKPVVLVVGSAVVEHILTVTDSDHVKIGEKQLVKRDEFVGGSGVNYACRLMAAGIPALPILPVANDRGGQKIQQYLLDLAKNNKQPRYVTEFIQDGFFWNVLSNTPQSTILISNGERSVFTESIGKVDGYTDFVKTRIEKIHDLTGDPIGAVMIGHIQLDKKGSREKAGSTTKFLIDTFSTDHKVFVNLGNTQYRLGKEFWKDSLKKVTVFQLSINEAREFFRVGQQTPNDPSWTLGGMFQWFSQENITAVITLERFGAVAQMKKTLGTDQGGQNIKKKEELYFGWPYEIDNFVDGTGAGDAFLAGTVSELMSIDKRPIRESDFQGAIVIARMWAAYACTKPGGANDPPSPDDLALFKNQTQTFWPVVNSVREESELILKLLDRAF